jgi:limonene-1,2-epoxide hydrolase
MRHKLAIAFVIASTACITNLAYSTDETQVATFNLHHVASRDAATVLRTIVGVKKFEAADDHTITVRDTQENLELAAAVVKMLDTADDTADTAPLPAGDGSVIAAVALDRASSKEVMDALRRELRIARIATAGEKRVFLRDTDSQVQAALKVIERVEGNHEDS